MIIKRRLILDIDFDCVIGISPETEIDSPLRRMIDHCANEGLMTEDRGRATVDDWTLKIMERE